MMFQELLAKELELRITVIGAQVFVAAVPTGDAVDVRSDPALIDGYRAYDGLPDAVRARLMKLLDRLGLDFASVDLVKTRDDRWVLLEVNSTSYFDHIERAAGLPIAGAVADLLLGRAPSRARRA
jgi:glutathione synthase/RimK-type ligase-like ATP-grasp enzyme